MEQKVYYGALTPADFASALVGYFNRGNFQVQALENEHGVVVQVATSRVQRSGGQTALSAQFTRVEDGVMVRVGQQTWFGIAASLGRSAMAAWFNPFSLLGNLDDIAQDFESMQLHDTVWKVIDEFATSHNAGQRLTLRLRRVVCSFCNTPNQVGDPSCVACGAPLGSDQPSPCAFCGFLFEPSLKRCPNCGRPTV